MYPDLNLYLLWNPLNSDTLCFAREYLEYGDQIIFVHLQLAGGDEVNWVYPPQKETIIDVADFLPGTIPLINGEEFEPELFGVYRIVKSERSKMIAAEYRSGWTEDAMKRFTAVFTDLPLSSEYLKCLVYDEYSPVWHIWGLGKSMVERDYYEDYDHRELLDMYSDMNQYFSWDPLNPDLLDLAREYLDHGDRILFVDLRLRPGLRCTLPTKEITVDISDVPPGTMPIIDRKQLEPEVDTVYRITKKKT